MDIMRQSVCLVMNPNMVCSYFCLHNDGSGLRLKDDPELKLSLVGRCLMYVLGCGFLG